VRKPVFLLNYRPSVERKIMPVSHYVWHPRFSHILMMIFISVLLFVFIILVDKRTDARLKALEEKQASTQQAQP